MKQRGRFVMALSGSLAMLLTSLSCSPVANQQPAKERTSQDADSGNGGQVVAAIEPSVELTPRQVVQLQLDELRGGVSDTSGLASAIKLAVPSEYSQAPRPFRFATAVKRPDNRSLLEYPTVELGATEFIHDFAQQLVFAENDSGQIDVYLFRLRRPTVGPYAGCWLTDAVFRGHMRDEFSEPPPRIVPTPATEGGGRD